MKWRLMKGRRGRALPGVVPTAWGDGKRIVGAAPGENPDGIKNGENPLREALDFLRDELSQVFEREGEKIFQDVWEARNGYIEVILNRSPERIKSFFDQYGCKEP